MQQIQMRSIFNEMLQSTIGNFVYEKHRNAVNKCLHLKFKVNHLILTDHSIET